MARLKAFASARMEKSWYSTAEVARRVGLSKRETLQLIKGGEIKAIWIGGSAGYRISVGPREVSKGSPGSPVRPPPPRLCGWARLGSYIFAPPDQPLLEATEEDR